MFYVELSSFGCLLGMSLCLCCFVVFKLVGLIGSYLLIVLAFIAWWCDDFGILWV